MSGAPINVLLVEDNPGDVTLLKVLLSEECGDLIHMKTASRLSEAITALDAGGMDVVLLDLTLPDAQGIEAIVRLQAHASRIPIIVQTGLDDDDLAVRAMQLGAQDYITKGKPDGRLLVRRIRQAIERTRTSRELADERRRMDALLENIPDRVYFKSREGAFIQVNPALARLYGFEDPRQVIGKTDSDFFAPEHARQARADEEKVLTTGMPIVGKMEEETFPDGRTTWALTTKMPLKDETGTIVGTFGVSRDITDLKTAELALRTSEERYARLLDSFTDYVYTVVIQDGHVASTQHGPGCLAVTGYSPEEFAADQYLWHGIIFPDDREAVIQSLARSAEDGAPFEVEHRLIRKDGEIRWVRNKQVPRRNTTGHIVSYDGLMSDITEKKRANEELKAAHAHLMQLEKLHSIGQLAAGVAHEVKNPLQIILIGLQYLSDSQSTKDDQTLSVLTEMNDAVRRASCVVQDLLDYSSPRELGMQPRSINALIEKSLGFVRHDLSAAKIQIIRNLDSSLPETLLDPNKIEQVFVNLLTNACHAMPDGGTLTVSSRARTVSHGDFAPHNAGDRSGIGFHAGADAIIVEIRDTGTGLAPGTRGKLFEPFFTTKSTGKGSGLGLSVTRKIMDLHRGKISIENHPEGGVIATLTFKPSNPENRNTKEPT